MDVGLFVIFSCFFDKFICRFLSGRFVGIVIYSIVVFLVFIIWDWDGVLVGKVFEFIEF